MKQYKLIYSDGKEIIVNGTSALDIVRKYDLASQANIDTRMVELWYTYSTNGHSGNSLGKVMSTPGIARCARNNNAEPMARSECSIKPLN